MTLYKIDKWELGFKNVIIYKRRNYILWLQKCYTLACELRILKINRFYQDAWFKELRRKDFPDYAFTIVYLGLDGDDYELELTYNYDHGPYVVGDGFFHIALSTPDLEALHQEHSAKGYEVTEIKGSR